MMAEFDKLKEDMAFQIQKNDDMNNNLSVNMGQRRRAEDDLFRITKEFDEFKCSSRESQANDAREIAAMQSKARDLQTRLDNSENEKRHCLEQLQLAHKDN